MSSPDKVSKPKKATRSRAGCSNCKKRKKKCDEIKPICTGCYKRNLVCQYGDDELELVDDQNEDVKITTVPWRDLLNDDAIEQLLTPWQDPELQPLLELRSLDFNFEFDLEIKNDNNEIEPLLMLDFPTEITRKELIYLESFCKQVLPELSVLPQEINHYIRLFVPMAMKDRAVLYCLICWGYRIRKSHSADYQARDEEYEKYLKLVNRLLEAKENDLGKFNFVSSVISYLLLVSMEVSFGDTKMWAPLFASCFNLINKMPGGFLYLSKECGLEGVILAECFIYFDVLASQSNENGTFYPLSEYTEVLKGDSTLLHDPFQGCMRPLALQLAKTVTLLVEYNTLRITATTPDSSTSRFDKFSDSSMGNCDRYSVISEMLEKANNLDNEISFCKPDMGVLKMLRTRDDLENHLTMFEAMQIATQLYLRQVIKNLPPIVPEVEMLTVNLKQDMKFLVEKEIFKKNLAFPMLMLGLCVNTAQDREEVKEFFESLVKMCGYLSSYQRIWMVIQKVWELNNNGQVYVDWFKITNQMGWKLNLAR